MPTQLLRQSPAAARSLARSTGPAAEFIAISKDYPGPSLAGSRRRALADISFAVERGEVFGLLGPNRAGKTTLAKILLTLVRPNSGQAYRLGSPVSDRRTLARVGYVHEHPAFPGYLSPREILRFHGALAQVSPIAAALRIPDLLERFGLADRAREPIASFSKGMAQRLGVAVALISAPELLVLDEPAEGLDLAGRKLVRELIRERRERGETTILISHVVSDIETLCDRAAILIEGRLAAIGTVADFVKARREHDLESALESLYALNQG